MTTLQLLSTIVATLLAASRLAVRFRPFWALLPERVRPWAPAAVVITGTLAGLLAGGVGAEDAIADIALACLTAAGLAAPGMPPSEPPKPPTVLVVSGLLALLALASCAPGVQLGADAVRATCTTCRRIAPVCDAVSPAPSASAVP